MGKTVTLPNQSHVGLLARKRPRLRLVYTLAEGIVKDRVYSLPVGQTWLGRELPPNHEGIDVPSDVAMSSIHALIEVSTNDYHVRINDTRSKNGTFVGRTRVPDQWLPIVDGEFVRAGNSIFLLRAEPAHIADAEIPTLIGVSQAISELRARIVRVASESVSVLLCGETGTGKEVVARALHQQSQRRGELIAVNCAAIPDSLAESELFGHTERSFTGAQARQGAFRRADRGTLFLDEIGDMSLELQAKLLRVLEDRVVTPVGSDRAFPLDVRIVAATNHDLGNDVGDGVFRSDLQARLAHIQIDLPPLRARREDILLLLSHASSEAAYALTPDLVQDLLLYDWPQNVREIRSIAERLRIEGISAALCERLCRLPVQTNLQILTDSVGPTSLEDKTAKPRTVQRPHRLHTPTKEKLLELLRQHQGVVQYVAEDIGCSRRQARRWMESHDLDPDEFRGSVG